MEKINEVKSYFFERISNIDKPLTRLAKIKKDKTNSPLLRIKPGISLQVL